MQQIDLLRQSATVLEWPVLLEVLAGHARSAMGSERCRNLPLETDLGAANTRLQETAEMVATEQRGDPFPSLSFPDVRPVVDRAAKGAALEALELRDVSVVLEIAAEVARYVRRRREILPTLAAVAAPVDGLQPVKQAIDRCIDTDGNIRESATPELRRLMRHAQDLKQRMRDRLEVILASKRYADVLQEKYFAERERRYVVPVKSEMRNKIPGIVHDVSASGATVFLEPRELVELNNAIKVAELEVEREVRRILQELSTMVAETAAILNTDLDVLARLDCIAAKAAFSRQIQGHDISLNVSGRIALRQARHPLLALAKADVVPNDLILDDAVRVLVISGPNTGGKTVTLKLIGVVALMVRAGLQPPCAVDSEMALFPEVYADIGDAQDLAKDLSSFSAHITQMIRLLQEASPAPSPALPLQGGGEGGGSPRALVLLDELVTSTDPAEGAALAEALLMRLSELGVKVVVTTHYQSLKSLAQTTTGFMNASVEFDVSRLAPTYRVIVGMPGGSSAIEIAGRLGLDEAILDRALELMKQEGRAAEARVEQMLSDLHEKQRVLDADLARISDLKREAERAAREAAEIAERLQASEREDRRRAKKQLTDEMLQARAEVQAVLENLKAERTLVKAKDTKQRLAEIQERARQRLERPATSDVTAPPIPIDRLEIGDRVEIVSLGTSGTLVESPKGKKRVRVKVGDTEMSIAVGLLAASVGPDEPQPVSSRAQPWKGRGHSSPSEDAVTVLDVRGRAADEALDMVTMALDRAVLAGAQTLRIIHGHGTGRLRQALREYLKTSPYVAGFRSGERMEGGDGVTIVALT